jgi:hypothetical protein
MDDIDESLEETEESASILSIEAQLKSLHCWSQWGKRRRC